MANRLADQSSPYLQQHKENPVDWWPWSSEAFDEARRRDVPVFLSIGYATCHWCHVMAHESFEDDDVAAFLNRDFVPIKVDREERPDVDADYMAVCQAMTGRGGWPLTAVLAPDGRPWFAGTYFPRDSRPGLIGMMDLLPRLVEAWRERRDDVLGDADRLLDHLRRSPAAPGDAPDGEVLAAATEAVLATEDKENGGFRGAPKFPSLQTVRFLLRRGLDGDPEADAAARRQLDAMARGGIRDHVGGGFHRYSTDAAWHLPHFEKMLYDQAMALLAYAEAHMSRPSPLYKEVLEETVAYLLRDLRHDSGAFYAAEDADSEGAEGRFYTWPWVELLDALDGDEELARALGARPEGNHHEEATRAPVDRNILSFADPAALEGPLAKRWSNAKPRLREVRSRRVRPLRDEKVLADWNGLAAAGLAAAGRALDRPELVDAGRACLHATATLHGAVAGDAWDPAAVRHAWTGGRAGKQRFLEDTAGFAFGLAHVAMAGHRPGDAALASAFLDACDAHRGEGGAYHRRPLGEASLVPQAEGHDGAIPSGNALLAEADLLATRLLSGDAPGRTDTVLEAFGPMAHRHPAAFTGLLGVAADLLARHAELVVVTQDPSPFLPVLAHRAHPRLHALVTSGEDPWLPRHRPFLDFGSTGVFLCRGDACEAVEATPEGLDRALQRTLALSAASAASAASHRE